jgi:hypothetical protein
MGRDVRGAHPTERLITAHPGRGVGGLLALTAPTDAAPAGRSRHARACRSGSGCRAR